jgi:hypothetical protein
MGVAVGDAIGVPAVGFEGEPVPVEFWRFLHAVKQKIRTRGRSANLLSIKSVKAFKSECPKLKRFLETIRDGTIRRTRNFSDKVSLAEQKAVADKMLSSMEPKCREGLDDF